MKFRKKVISCFLLLIVIINASFIAVGTFLERGSVNNNNNKVEPPLNALFSENSDEEPRAPLRNTKEGIRDNSVLAEEKRLSGSRAPTGGWVDSSFFYRKNITILASQVTVDLTDFPVLIDLYDSDLQQNARADGWDIMFTDASGNQLDHELELYDRTFNASHAHLVSWVKANLSSSQNTIISMYFGKNIALNQENPQAVWDDNYNGVWHLTETSSGSTVMYDSTSNNHDGSCFGNPTLGVTGIAGSAINFDGINDYISFTNPIAQTTGSYSFWVYPRDVIGEFNILANSDIISRVHIYNGKIRVETDTNEEMFYFTSSSVLTNTWTHFVFTKTGDFGDLYVNGSWVQQVETVGANTLTVSCIGGTVDEQRMVDGIIDEVRISSNTRSANWIETEFNNQKNPASFYSVGITETSPVTDDWALPIFRYRKSMTIAASKVSGTGSLTDFPVLIDLTDGDLRNGIVQSDGDDILFVDENALKLPYEIEIFEQNNTHGHLRAWIKVPTVYATVNTNLTMYYGNNAVGSQADPENVWNNYRGVWHLEEEGVGAVDEYQDSSLYDNHGQGGEGVSSDVPTRTGGLIGYGQSFDGAGDIVGVGNSNTLQPDVITFSAWVKRTTSWSSKRFNLFWAKGASWNSEGWYVQVDDVSNGNTTDRDIMMVVDGSNMYMYRGGDPDDIYPLNEWVHIALAFDSSTNDSYIFFNGTSQTVQNFGSPNSITKTNDVKRLGGNELLGMLDEVRISNTILSADWIATEYANQLDPENFIGYPEDQEEYSYWWVDGSFSKRKDIVIDKDKVGIFKYRKSITIDHNKVAGTGSLTDFPVLIDLYDSDLHNPNKVQSDGDDIIFKDTGGTKLDHEIELFDQLYNNTHAHLVAWIRIPTLSGTSDTTFTMHYGNSTMSNQENPDGVWNNNYNGVWHFSELSGQAQDSSSYGTDGTLSGGMTQGVNGQIGYSYGFDGVEGLVNMGDPSDGHLDFGTGSFTVGCWVNKDWMDIDQYGGIFKGNGNVDNAAGWLLRFKNTNHVRFSGGDGTDGVFNLNPSNVLINNTWVFVVGVLDRSAGKAYVYLNGQVRSTDTSITSGDIDSDRSLVIGEDWSSSIHFKGFIDEIRISDAVRSSNWILTEFNNQNDSSTFFSIGLEVSEDLTDFPVLIDITDNKFKSGCIQSDFDDVLFTDANGTKLAHEIEYVVQGGTNGRLVAWVRVPTLFTAKDTIISMYYGNDELKSQQNPEGVWNANYMGIWHLREDASGTGTTDVYKDSTSNDNDGDDYISATGQNGQIDGGQEFDGSDDYVEIPDVGSFTTITISAWIYPTDWGESMENWIHHIFGDEILLVGATFAFRTGSQGLESLKQRLGLGININSVWVDYESSSNLTLNTWQQVVATFDGSKVKLFINGVNDKIQSNSGTISDMGNNFTIGRALPFADDDRCFEGSIDEIHLMSTALPEYWISTEYKNQLDPSSFYFIGSEIIFDFTPPIINDFGVDDLGDGNPQFWADVSDATTLVSTVTIAINGTEYEMSKNGTGHWIYIFTANDYGDFVTYQIVNSSDVVGNYITETTTTKNYTLDFDTVDPNVVGDEWDYDPNIGEYGAFLVNVTDDWGVIDTVLVNVTETNSGPTNNLTAVMRLTASGYMNDTLIMESGPIWFEFIMNDTAGNTAVSSSYPDIVPLINHPPTASNLTFSPLPIHSNETLTLSYEYDDSDGHAEANTKIRWYKNGLLQGSFNDSTQVPHSNLYKGDKWNATVKPQDSLSLFGDLVWSSTITVQNTAPRISSHSLTPSNPTTISELTCNYNYDDYDNDLENVIAREIRWYKEGLLQSALNDSLTVGAGNTTKSENWFFRLRIFDGFNYSNWVQSATVLIENTAPTASNLAITPSDAQTGDNLVVIYDWIDPDSGDTDTGSIILWYKNTNLQVNLNNCLIILSGNTTKGDIWYFKITPYDGTDYGSEQTSSSVIIQNTPPIAGNLTITPGSPVTGNTLILNYDWQDDDTSDFESGTEIIWYKNGVLQDVLNDSLTVASSYTAEGDIWHVKVHPSDSVVYGAWVSCPVNVTIGNSVPTASDLVIIPSAPKSENDLTATYTWADNDTLDIEDGTQIRWYKNGVLQPDLNDTLVILAGNISKGEIWHFKIHPSDGDSFGPWSNCPLNVTIGNTPPTVSNVKINETSPVNNDLDLHVNYTYNDYDNDGENNTLLEILWYEDGTLRGDLNNSLVVDAAETLPGKIWNFEIRVSDGTNHSEWGYSASVSIDSGANALPTVSNLNITPTTNTTNDALTINYTFSDTDGDDELGTMYYWYRNGVYMSEYNSFKTLPASATTKGETWHVKVRPRDGKDFGSLTPCPWNVTIVNTAPSANNLLITPSDPITGNNLDLSYLWVDDDTVDSESGTEIRWYKNGVLQPDLNDSLVILAGNTSKGDIWHFKVHPSDGEDFGNWYNCPVNVTIGNTAPSASNLAFLLSNPQTWNDLTASYTWNDPDSGVGDTESGTRIRWYRNGVLQPLLNDSLIVLSGNTTKGQTWYFTIEPCDGSSYGQLRTSAPITIINTAPTVSGITISPANARTTNALNVTYLWDDDDPTDTETGTKIIWYKNGVLQGPLNNSDTIIASYTTKGDIWHVKIRPSDGTDEGSWTNCSFNVTILNSEPIPTSQTIFPSAPIYTTNTLIASFSGSDADNDAIIGFDTRWYNGSSEVTNLANCTEVPSNYTKKAQVWRFEVRLFDGEGWSNWFDSTPLSVPILIQNSLPTVTNVTLSGGETTKNDIVLSYSFIDADGDIESSNTLITWWITHSGTPTFSSVTIGNGGLVLSNSSITAGDYIYCMITPDDGTVSGTPVFSTFYHDGYLIVGNTAPEIMGLPTILGTNSTTMYTTTTTLYANYSVYDLDSGESDIIYDVEISEGLVIGAEYRWYQNNILRSDLKGATVDSTHLYEGDEWKLSVRPRDRYGSFGAWVNSTQIIIGNSWPIITDIIWTTTNPTREDDLTFSYNYLDYDNDAEIVNMVKIYWFYNNGTEITQVRNQTALIHQLNILVRGDEVYVVVSPFDGENYGLNYTSTVLTIGNALPRASNVVITPSTPFTNDILTLSWNYSDPDGDNEVNNPIIQWYRNGIIFSAFENQTVVPTVYTSKGELWWATVLVFDGAKYSLEYLSTTVEIENTPISIDQVAINGNASSTFADTNLIISWTYSDQDGDAYTDILIEWYRNGEKQVSYTNQTIISTSALLKGYNWYCVVQMFDGQDWSENQTSQIILIINKAPVITVPVFIDHSYTNFLVEDENIKISYNFADVDADSDSSLVRWFKDGIYVPSFDNQTIIFANETQPGEIWHFVITPSDGITNGIPVISQNMTIESRPTILDFGSTPLTDTEGHYKIWIKVDDPRNPIHVITFDLLSESIPAQSNGTHYVLDYQFDLSYLDSTINVTGMVSTRVVAIDANPPITISTNAIISISIVDHAPPRIINVIYFWDDDFDPSKITFIAEIEEKGSDIEDIVIYYYFKRTKVEESEEPSTAIPSGNSKHIIDGFTALAITQTIDEDIEWQNATMEPINATHWGITVDFKPKSDVDILFRIYVADRLGNINDNAYPVGLNPEGRQKFKLQTGVDPAFVQMILIVVGIAFVLVIIFSAVAIKKWRATELVGLDKERVFQNITKVSDFEVMSSLDLHTLGIVISFFDQRQGPIPIIVIPELLKDNFDKLIELSDCSFSTGQFLTNFDTERSSTFDFPVSPILSVNCISFSYSLDRPQARGGSEHITLNILVQPSIFPLVNQFINELGPMVSEIHRLMDDSPTEKDMILERIIKLRKFITYIILSYKDLYGTTELITEEFEL